jgi:hypothetical protein
MRAPEGLPAASVVTKIVEKCLRLPRLHGVRFQDSVEGGAGPAHWTPELVRKRNCDGNMNAACRSPLERSFALNLRSIMHAN